MRAVPLLSRLLIGLLLLPQLSHALVHVLVPPVRRVSTCLEPRIEGGIGRAVWQAELAREQRAGRLGGLSPDGSRLALVEIADVARARDGRETRGVLPQPVHHAK